MDIRLPFYTHNSAHLAIFRLVHHYKRLRHLTFIQIINLLCYLRCKVLVFELAASGIRIDHQTGVHYRILVLREMDYRLLKLNAIRFYQLPDTIQPLDGIYFVRRTDSRAE